MDKELINVFEAARGIQSVILNYNNLPETCPRSLTEPVLSSSFVDKKKYYILSIIHQINSTYLGACYDACSILIRKLIEILIIEIYESNGFIDDIQDPQGNIKELKSLIDFIEQEKRFHIDKKTKKMLKFVKDKGDNSAHVRRYFATRKDIEEIINNHLRVGIQELIHLCNFN